MNKNDVLLEYFGHTEFRSGQADIIDSILAGRDVLGIMPTGAGKSICYQVPALMLEGITVVISPLISLMADQVGALVRSGINAAYINSSLTYPQYREVFRRAEAGRYKIIYVAPERLLTEEFLNLAAAVKISMVTVDEAHCVSQWGQDFRPSYLKITEFISSLPYRPVVSAFTATATGDVRDDISSILKLNDPFTITTGFDRKNLYFGILNPKDKFAELIKIINRNKGKSGIVYCITRKGVEEVAEKLCAAGIPAAKYHAGLPDEERKQSQEDFIFDRRQVIVATNAFGMGIDKSDVSYVVHYNMPKNLEEYYQEAGRAGRDGEPAECILLYSGRDVRTNRFLIENGNEGNPDITDELREELKKRDLERLKAMTFYSTLNGCLREYILRYFGERAPNYCGNCSCCTNFETVDITVEAQKIVSCVYRVNNTGRCYGRSMIADILNGSKRERVLSLGFDKLSTYGIMTDMTQKRIVSIIDYLAQNGWLEICHDEYSVVKTTPRSAEIVKNRVPIEMKLPKEQETVVTIKDASGYTADEGLFAVLRKLRSTFAAEEHVPAYIIFTDAALKDMCRRLPFTQEEFLNVSGVGKHKTEKYGEVFCAAIEQYASEHPEIKEKAMPKPIYMENVSLPWTDEEDVQLSEEIGRGLSVREIGELHKRPLAAVRLRLKWLGLTEN